LGAASAELSFSGEVLDFFEPDNRGEAIAYPVERRASIKDVIESLGVPHTEVGTIVVDGREVGFSHLLGPGERVQIMPHEIPVRVDRPSLLRPRPYPRARFIVDVNVGKLARYLRLLGFDTAYEHGWKDWTIAAKAHVERRVVLSRDRDLLKRSAVEHGRLIRSQRPKGQLAEVLRVFGLEGPYELFSRCLRCNVVLRPVAKEAVLHMLEPKTRRYFDEFSRCPACERVYWRGSHHQRMVEELKELGIDPGAGS
jgi:uncharacterized protein